MPVCGNYLFFELPKKIVLNPKDGNLGTGTFNHHGVTEFANIRQMNRCVELIKDLLTIQ